MLLPFNMSTLSVSMTACFKIWAQNYIFSPKPPNFRQIFFKTFSAPSFFAIGVVLMMVLDVAIAQPTSATFGIVFGLHYFGLTEDRRRLNNTQTSLVLYSACTIFANCNNPN